MLSIVVVFVTVGAMLAEKGGWLPQDDGSWWWWTKRGVTLLGGGLLSAFAIPCLVFVLGRVMKKEPLNLAERWYWFGSLVGLAAFITWRSLTW